MNYCLRVCLICLVILTVPVSCAIAEDASYTLTVTNRGEKIAAWFAAYPPGEQNKYRTSAHSGQTLRIPGGTYDIGIHFEKDAVKLVKWVPGKVLIGKLNEQFDLDAAIVRVSYKITNGGVDVGRKALWGLYQPGQHSRYLAYKFSGDPMTISAGSYDIGIEYADGNLKRTKWLENEKLESTTERTVELGEAVTHANVSITNGGVDVGRKARWEVYRPGAHGRYLAYKYSSEPMTIGAGTYNIGIIFQDGEAKERRWIENQVFESEYNRVYELGLPIAPITVRVTNYGVDVGKKSWWGLYDTGERGQYLAYKRGGETMTFPEDTYDLGVHFEDGAVKITRWISDFVVKGKTEKTVELSAAMADLTVRVTLEGKLLEKAWCGAYKPGVRTSYDAYAYSEKPMRVLTGRYDIGCFCQERGVASEKWLENQEISSNTRLAVEMDLKPASLTVVSRGKAKGEFSSRVRPENSSDDTNIALILDSSGSMAAKVEQSKTRLEVAKEVLGEVIDILPNNVRVELQAYGTSPKAAVDCKDTKVFYPLGPVDPAALKSSFAGLAPGGYTPIAYSLEKAAGNLPRGKNNSLVLITDGIESCHGDPCAVASRLSAQGFLTRSFVVGFGLGLDKGKFMSCIGRYYPASDRQSLQAALREVMSESVKPLSGHVLVYKPGDRTQVVVQGSLDQKHVFQSGTYDVLVRAGEKEYSWPGLKILGDMEKTIGE